MLDAYGNKPEFKDAIWLKVDDDIVFIRDGAIEAMVLEKRTRAHECGVLSANVVNHPVLAHVHQRIGVYTASYAPPNWQRNKGDPHRYFYEYDPWGQCSLKSYDCAKNTHLTFLHNAHQDTDLQMCVSVCIRPAGTLNAESFVSGIADFISGTSTQTTRTIDFPSIVSC